MNDIKPNKHLKSALNAKQNIIEDLTSNDDSFSFAFNQESTKLKGLIALRKNYDYFIGKYSIEVFQKDNKLLSRNFNLLSIKESHNITFVNFSDTRNYDKSFTASQVFDIWNNSLEGKINLHELSDITFNSFEKYLNLLYEISDNKLIEFDNTVSMFSVMSKRNEEQPIPFNKNNIIEFLETKSLISDVNHSKTIQYLKNKDTLLNKKEYK